MSELPSPSHGKDAAAGPDLDLDQVLRDGMPAVLETCRHTRQVISQDGLFLVSGDDGALYHHCTCGTGLYFHDTRYLSGWRLALAGQKPTLLSFSAERNFMSRIEFMNAHLALPNGVEVPQESIHLSVTRLIRNYVHERIEVVNYSPTTLDISLTCAFTADFADMFEVRGAFKGHRGQFLPVETGGRAATLSYQGADGILRRTRFGFFPEPVSFRRLEAAEETGFVVEFCLRVLGGGGRSSIEIHVIPEQGDARCALPARTFADLGQWLHQEQTRRNAGATRLHSDNAIYNLVLQRSVLDLETLTSIQPETGPYISAGIPWFACPFGRDAILAAYQSLILGPELAKGTLRYLARFQGRDLNDFRDEEPGKILHEIRYGELTNLGLVPHAPYYGSIDSTPLFLILISETYRWSGDLDFVREMWEAIEQALMWIDAYGDQDGDGFLEYSTRSTLGLYNQNWKDSHNSNIGPDFRIASLPIAVVEVQGYVYDAKRRMAELCYALDLRVMGDRLVREAEDLKQAFNRAFWSEIDGFYALALDGEKQPVRTLASNMGHALWSGIIDSSRIPEVVRRLLAPDMFSGWGIRTLSAAMPPYNPLSYHNGSVWPHDNSLIACGLASLDYKTEALGIMESMYEATLKFPYFRLPELFCGFSREGELDTPVPYPVACSPQAWAAGANLLFLQSILGLSPDASRQQLLIRKPVLPCWLDNVYLRGLRVGQAHADLQFVQLHGVTTARVLEKSGGPLKIMIEG
ncbi:MAG: amylo-alpha-1,6-glucosidase [Candidatus Sericytochromatia bacterium]|nr:amylo-alpha-1,6-glucosidase [Candidatus Sericytochromatia bacterium]